MTLDLHFFCLAIVLILMSACASTNRTTFSNDDTRLEKINKVSYNATDWADQYFVKPVAQGYNIIMPDPAEDAVSRAFSNIREVGSVANSLLQGKVDQAVHDAGRFVANGTLGVLGLFEVAESMGLKKNQPEDFGQTLAKWGVDSGSYVYIPLLGPSTLRDAPSGIVDYFFNPMTYIDESTTKYVLSVTDLLQQRASAIASEEIISGDRYLFLKDAYLQRRQYLIDDGQLSDEPDDFDADF